jgi:hypothetical protein
MKSNLDVFCFSRRTRGRSSSGASSQVLSADENSSGSHLVLSPGSASASASPRVVSSPPPLGFKFPKTKKVLMNEWLNKPEPPLSPLKLEDGEACIGGAAAAKKRWLRQAISEESEPPPSSSQRPASPDYVTPLKKRRLARESLEQHSCTPPATASSPELDVETPKPTPNLPLRCVEEAVLALSGHMGIKIELKEPLPPPELTPCPPVETLPIPMEVEAPTVCEPPPVLSPAPVLPPVTPVLPPALPPAPVLSPPPVLMPSVAPAPVLPQAPPLVTTPTLPLALLSNPTPPPPPPLPISEVIKEEVKPKIQTPPTPAAVKRKVGFNFL